MGFVALIFGLLLSFNSHILFNEISTNNELRIVKILMLFLIFNMALSFPMSVYSAIIASQEKFIFQKLVNIGKKNFESNFKHCCYFNGLWFNWYGCSDNNYIIDNRFFEYLLL